MKIKLILIKKILYLFIIFLISNPIYSQNIYNGKKFQFLSFRKIPTWVGLITDWNKDLPQVQLYDFNQYRGHAEYISKALKTGITFKQFKENVKNPVNRKYLPFFLFDLRENAIAIKGKNYEWALRLEDYEYEDSQEQMGKTVIKLMNLVSLYIKQQSGDESKGIIILATDSKARPNNSIAGRLNNEGFPNMTLSELASRSGAKKVEVLNPGIGIGYLKYIKAGEEQNESPSIKDILVYEKLPSRVPPVNGIITLEPQTPLSHINLLARNRGTFNLYTSNLKSIPGAEGLINKLVRIECTENKISISEIKIEEAQKFWAKHLKTVEIPIPEITINKIISLNEANKDIQNSQCIGAKAANYAIIRQMFPEYVRPGFAIPFSFYFNTIKSCGADTLIQSLIKLKSVETERNKQLEEIRAVILNAKLDPALIIKINNLVKNQFNNSPIRLRSSTNCEDLPEFNGAGLYISKGYKLSDGDKKLADKILQVYASLWSSLAFNEREFYLIDHSKVGMAILINESFPNEYANGVALTIVYKKQVSLLINSQYGENSVTNPENDQIPEAVLFKSVNDNSYDIQSKSNIHDVFLQDSLKNMLFELKKVVTDIHHAFIEKLDNNISSEYGIDIEFKIEQENNGFKLYIKQARLLKSVLPY